MSQGSFKTYDGGVTTAVIEGSQYVVFDDGDNKWYVSMSEWEKIVEHVSSSETLTNRVCILEDRVTALNNLMTVIVTGLIEEEDES
jgi:hypothetical protein